MPTPTYTILQQVTLVNASTSVVFSAIPQSFRDLVLVCSARSTSSSVEDYAYLYMNRDTSYTYYRVEINGNGSSSAAAAFSNLLPLTVPGTGASSNKRGLSIVNIMDYSAIDKHKTCLYRNDPQTIADLGAGRWASNSAITTLTLTSYYSYGFTSGSTFTLYGVHG